MTDIELPELPNPTAHGNLHNFYYASDQMREYARAAVEADRKKRAEESEALRLLAILFDEWESGLACYENPDDQEGYLGNAVKLTDATFEECCNLLNAAFPDGKRFKQSLVQPLPTEVDQKNQPDFERMFMSACVALGDIHNALGLDPDDAEGAEPILEAIKELKQSLAQPALKEK